MLRLIAPFVLVAFTTSAAAQTEPEPDQLEAAYPNVRRYVGPSQNGLAEFGAYVASGSVGQAALERADPGLARQNWEAQNPILAAATKHEEAYPERFGPSATLKDVLTDLDHEIETRQSEAVLGTVYPMTRRYNPDVFFARPDEEVTRIIWTDYRAELTERFGPYPDDTAIARWAEDRAMNLFQTTAAPPSPTRVVAALEAATGASPEAPTSPPSSTLQALGLHPLVPSLAVFVRHVETMQGNPELYGGPDRSALAYTAGVYQTEASEAGDLLVGVQGLLDQSLQRVAERRSRTLDVGFDVALVILVLGSLGGLLYGFRRWRREHLVGAMPSPLNGK